MTAGDIAALIPAVIALIGAITALVKALQSGKAANAAQSGVGKVATDLHNHIQNPAAHVLPPTSFPQSQGRVIPPGSDTPVVPGGAV